MSRTSEAEKADEKLHRLFYDHERDTEIKWLKDLLTQILDNSKLVLKHQPGQERKVLEEIVYIIEKQQREENDIN